MGDTSTADDNHESSPVLRLVPWWEPELALNGHPPTGEYVERFWLPVLGPSALLTLRWCARTLAEHPAGTAVPLHEIARSVGLGGGRRGNGPVGRAFERLVYFGLARHTPSGLAVRTHAPSVGPSQLRRLPRPLQEAHPRWLLRSVGDSTLPSPDRPNRVAQ